MKIHLKKITVYPGSSKKSNNYDADVYCSGKKIGRATNTGNGDPTILTANWERKRLFDEIMLQDPDLRTTVDNIIKDHIQEQHHKKFMSQEERACLTGLCYNDPGDPMTIQKIRWGYEGQWPIEKMLKNKIMLGKLKDKLVELRCEGKIILNKNLGNL